MINFDQDDINTMALCTWKEARGEGEEGMTAVAHVILNRANAWYSHFSDPIHYAVYAKNQFTSMSVNSDPEYNLEPKSDDVQYAFCITLCNNLMKDSTLSDPTRGALYYANLKESTSGWFFNNIVKSANHPLLATIGKQNFYA